MAKIKKRGPLGVGHYTGKILTSFTYDEINTVGNFWKFRVDKKIAFHNLSFVQEGIKKNNLYPPFQPKTMN